MKKILFTIVSLIVAFGAILATAAEAAASGVQYAMIMGLMTHALTFEKESVTEFFVDPLFHAVDIRDQITVRTDIKGTEKLNRISRPSKLTRKKTVRGFNPVGAMVLTQTDLTVKQAAIEFEQNGRDFLNSVLEQALAQGWEEDDVEAMTGPAFWNEIVLPIVAEAGLDDLIRQMWFNDETKETNVAGIITGNADVDYDIYTGFWTRFFQEVTDALIPAAQYVAINNGAVKQELIETLDSITAGTLTLTVNGTAYDEAFDTDSTTTISNWFASHAATILARGELTGVVITNSGAAELTFIAKHAGQGFTVVETDAGTNGNLTLSGVVANVGHAALGSDEADATFTAMIDAMPVELQEFGDEARFYVTRTMLRNYIATLKGTGTEAAHQVLLNGQMVHSYEGIPIFVRPEWDKWINVDHNDVYPHRAVLTIAKNLFFGTDGAQDDENVETWYDRNEQLRRYRVQYKGGTIHLHRQLVVVAY